LHVLDTVWERRYAHLGVLVRYVDDFVVVCRTREACEQAEPRVSEILVRLGLSLHPEKTMKVELSRGQGGFDFLGCHLRKRMSGRIWEKEGRRVYFLYRWPSQRSMKRVRQRIKELTPRKRCHEDLRRVIGAVNPVLRGWGSNYFRTGNAADQLNSIDRYVERRLKRLRVQRAGRSLRPGQFERWHRGYFEALGLVCLRSTIQYPEAA
jgi:RNA-directed DNA polymerase